jgi:polyhydroxyalkanoate synthesis regulator phasin
MTMENNNSQNNTWFDFVTNALIMVQQTTEGFQKVFENMAKDQKISWEEGKKFYDEFLKQTQTRKEEIENQTTKIFERIAQNLQLVTRKEYEELLKRVEDLEKKLEK